MPSVRPAVILNPLSGRLRRRPGAVRALAREISAERYAEASEPRAIAEAVAAFQLGEDDVLCIVGGDGTLHAALTALERLRPGGPWPLLAAAPGGTTNLTARALEAAGRLAPWLEALRDTPGRVVTRPALRVAPPGEDPLVGMVFGAGAVATGVEFFNTRLRPLGIPELVGSPLAVVRGLLAVAAGGTALDRMTPSFRVRVERGPELNSRVLFLAISPLERVILGARPFWGSGEGPLHMTLVERGARGIFPSVPRVLLGRPGRAMRPERGWHSHNAARLELFFDGPYIVDGELYHSWSAADPLVVTARERVRWWVP